jgi:hypothetical protein
MMDIEQIRVRIMSEAYDLADRGDLEGYNAVKVMCNDALELIAAVVAAEREACAKVCEERQEVFQKYYTKGLAGMCAEAIRARSKQ